VGLALAAEQAMRHGDRERADAAVERYIQLYEAAGASWSVAGGAGGAGR